jgi:histidinol-phosphate aminotransferase
MSKYWNERINNLEPYVPGEQPGKGERFIKLNTNENPYPPSPKVIEAIKGAADERLRLYPDPACRGFREAVAQCYGVNIEQVFAGNGSDEILAFIFGALFSINKGNILFPDISYSFYPVFAKLWGLTYRETALTEDFSINLDDYRVPNAGVILPNPNAPTGRAIPADELLRLAYFQERQGRVLIVDEAYIDFADPCYPLSAASYPANLLTVHTMSKSGALAGIRAGFAIGSAELIEGLCRIRDSFNSYTVDRIAQVAAAAALLDADYYRGVNKKVSATRDRISEILRSLNFAVLPSQSNFIFIKAPSIKGPDLFKALREKGVLVRHFDKPRINDYLRVSIGTDDDMDTFVNIIRAICKGCHS